MSNKRRTSDPQATRTITVEQFWNAGNILGVLFNEARTKDFMLSYRILKLRKGMDPHSERDAPHEVVRRELLEKYAKRIEGADAYSFGESKPEEIEAYVAAIREVAAQELVIPDIRLTLEDMSKLELRTGFTSSEIAAIDWLIEDAAGPEAEQAC